MPDISSISAGGFHPMSPPGRAESWIDRSGTEPIARGRRSESDRVDLSDHARFMQRLRSLPEVRLERVEAARAAIVRGDYDSDDMLATAIDRLIEDLD
jgi:hypothetical protein